MTARYAWPSAEFGALPIEGGVDAAFRQLIDSSPDPEQTRANIQQRLQRLQSPFPAVENLGIEDVIDPRDTRPMLIRALEAAIPAMDYGRGSKSRRGVPPRQHNALDTGTVPASA